MSYCAEMQRKKYYFTQFVKLHNQEFCRSTLRRNQTQAWKFLNCRVENVTRIIPCLPVYLFHKQQRQDTCFNKSLA